MLLQKEAESHQAPLLNVVLDLVPQLLEVVGHQEFLLMLAHGGTHLDQVGDH